MTYVAGDRCVPGRTDGTPVQRLLRPNQVYSRDPDTYAHPGLSGVYCLYMLNPIYVKATL